MQRAKKLAQLGVDVCMVSRESRPQSGDPRILAMNADTSTDRGRIRFRDCLGYYADEASEIQLLLGDAQRSTGLYQAGYFTSGPHSVTDSCMEAAASAATELIYSILTVRPRDGIEIILPNGGPRLHGRTLTEQISDKLELGEGELEGCEQRWLGSFAFSESYYVTSMQLADGEGATEGRSKRRRTATFDALFRRWYDVDKPALSVRWRPNGSSVADTPVGGVDADRPEHRGPDPPRPPTPPPERGGNEESRASPGGGETSGSVPDAPRLCDERDAALPPVQVEVAVEASRTGGKGPTIGAFVQAAPLAFPTASTACAPAEGLQELADEIHARVMHIAGTKDMLISSKLEAFAVLWVITQKPKEVDPEAYKGREWLKKRAKVLADRLGTTTKNAIWSAVHLLKRSGRAQIGVRRSEVRGKDPDTGRPNVIMSALDELRATQRPLYSDGAEFDDAVDPTTALSLPSFDALYAAVQRRGADRYPPPGRVIQRGTGYRGSGGSAGVAGAIGTMVGEEISSAQAHIAFLALVAAGAVMVDAEFLPDEVDVDIWTEQLPEGAEGLNKRQLEVLAALRDGGRIYYPTPDYGPDDAATGEGASKLGRFGSEEPIPTAVGEPGDPSGIILMIENPACSYISKVDSLKRALEQGQLADAADPWASGLVPVRGSECFSGTQYQHDFELYVSPTAQHHIPRRTCGAGGETCGRLHEPSEECSPGAFIRGAHAVTIGGKAKQSASKADLWARMFVTPGAYIAAIQAGIDSYGWTRQQLAGAVFLDLCAGSQSAKLAATYYGCHYIPLDVQKDVMTQGRSVVNHHTDLAAEDSDIETLVKDVLRQHGLALDDVLIVTAQPPCDTFSILDRSNGGKHRKPNGEPNSDEARQADELVRRIVAFMERMREKAHERFVARHATAVATLNDTDHGGDHHRHRLRAVGGVAALMTMAAAAVLGNAGEAWGNSMAIRGPMETASQATYAGERTTAGWTASKATSSLARQQVNHWRGWALERRRDGNCSYAGSDGGYAGNGPWQATRGREWMAGAERSWPGRQTQPWLKAVGRQGKQGKREAGGERAAQDSGTDPRKGSSGKPHARDEPQLSGVDPRWFDAGGSSTEGCGHLEARGSGSVWTEAHARQGWQFVSKHAESLYTATEVLDVLFARLFIHRPLEDIPTPGEGILRIAVRNVNGHLKRGDEFSEAPNIVRELQQAGADVALLQDTQRDSDSAGLTQIVRHAYGAGVRATADAYQSHRAYRQGVDNDATGWAAGVAVITAGEAAVRQGIPIEDCRGWGRYAGRVINGADGRRLVLVTTYYPPTSRGDQNATDSKYANELARKAAAGAPTGAVRSRSDWKPGSVPPAPEAASIAKPRQLLTDDLVMHFTHYARRPKDTLVIAGDFNIDRTRGDTDAALLEQLETQLLLVDLQHDRARGREPHTREMGALTSSVDRILVSEKASSAGVTPTLGVHWTPLNEAGKTDHALLLLDVNMKQALGVAGSNAAEAPEARFRSGMKYGDRKRVAHFRVFGQHRWENKSMDEAVESILRELGAGDKPLRAEAAEERAELATKRWDAKHVGSGASRGRLADCISKLAELLEGFAEETEKQFVATHGPRRVNRRGKNKQGQFGGGWSPQTVRDAEVHSRARVAERALETAVTRGGLDLWDKARKALSGLEQDGKTVPLPDCEEASIEARAALKEWSQRTGQRLHGRQRTAKRLAMLEGSAKRQREKSTVAAKKQIRQALERKWAGPLASVAVRGKGGETILTAPREIAAETARFGQARAAEMQPKWFEEGDIHAGSLVWAVAQDGVTQAEVRAIGADGRYELVADGGAEPRDRGDLCLRSRTEGNPPTVEEVRERAADDMRHLPQRTHLIFRTTPEGRDARKRLLRGELTEAELATLPKQFHVLLPAIRYKTVNKGQETERSVRPEDYTAMVGDDSRLKWVTQEEFSKKLAKVAKGKAPGASGRTVDLYAAMPMRWREATLELLNVIDVTLIKPTHWLVEVVNYVHKGGADQSLSNHRPLKLLECLRKIYMGVHTDRLTREWRRLGLLDERNSGFQSKRGTSNAILPVRLAVESALQNKRDLSILLDDLRWAFDCPSRGVIELALLRLGVPEDYIDVVAEAAESSAQTVMTAMGLTCDWDSETWYRQLHGTSQGSTEGPQMWMPVSDLVIAVMAMFNEQPAVMRGRAEGITAESVGGQWFVDDSALMQEGPGCQEALQRMADATGLAYSFLGVDRRVSKCTAVRVTWAEGKLETMSDRAAGTGLELREWTPEWADGVPHLRAGPPRRVKEIECDEEFRYLGGYASITGSCTENVHALKRRGAAATAAIARLPHLRTLGESIVVQALRPAVVYPLGFSKATEAEILDVERGFSAVVKHSLGLPISHAWATLAGALEYGGLGVTRLNTSVQQQRLRNFMQLAGDGTPRERAITDNALRAAQIWSGMRSPVTGLAEDEGWSLDPVGPDAPWAAVMLAQLHRSGYTLRLGWINPPRAERDMTLLEVIKPADAEERAAVQCWRRQTGAVWVSELLRDDGCTLRAWARDSLADAIGGGGRLAEALSRAFTSTTTVGAGTQLRPVGAPTRAGWAGVDVGSVLSVGGSAALVLSLKPGEVEVKIMEQCSSRRLTRAGGTNWAPAGGRMRLRDSEAPSVLDATGPDDEGQYKLHDAEAIGPAQVGVVSGGVVSRWLAEAEVAQAVGAAARNIRRRDWDNDLERHALQGEVAKVLGSQCGRLMTANGDRRWTDLPLVAEAIAEADSRHGTDATGSGSEAVDGSGTEEPELEGWSSAEESEDSVSESGGTDGEHDGRGEGGECKGHDAECRQSDARDSAAGHRCIQHQMLPYQWWMRLDVFRTLPHSEVAVAFGAMEGVSRARLQAEEAWAGCSDEQRKDVCMAYSDGSVTGNGTAGSAAAEVNIAGRRVTATIRLAPTDAPLSSGRAEWAGTLLVMEIVKNVGAKVQLRLDNKQVARASAESTPRRADKIMKMPDRDMYQANRAYRLQREQSGHAAVEVLHCLGHPERRKQRKDFDEHDLGNERVDAATHAATGPLVSTLSRPEECGFGLWYRPMEEENLGLGLEYEVVGDVYKHMSLAAGRRAAIGRRADKYGSEAATHLAPAMGLARSSKRSVADSRFVHGQLPDESRKAMYRGEGRVATCICGHRYKTQWHIFLHCPHPDIVAARTAWAAERRKVMEKHVGRDAAYDIEQLWGLTTSGVVPTPQGALGVQGGIKRITARVVASVDDEVEFGGDGGSEEHDDSPHETAASDARTLIFGATGAEAYDPGWAGRMGSSSTEESEALATLRARRNWLRDNCGGQEKADALWWTMTWPKDTAACMGILGRLDATRLRKFMSAMRAVMSSGWRSVWLAYQRLNRLYDLHDLPARMRLVDEWHAVAGRLGANYRDAKGNRIPQTGDVDRMPMHTLAKQLKQWTKESHTARARRAARQRITSHFRPVEAVARGGVGATGGEPGGRTSGKRLRQERGGGARAAKTTKLTQLTLHECAAGGRTAGVKRGARVAGEDGDGARRAEGGAGGERGEGESLEGGMGTGTETSAHGPKRQKR